MPHGSKQGATIPSAPRLTATALAAIPTARSHALAISAVTGLIVATILVGSALVSLATVIL